MFGLEANKSGTLIQDMCLFFGECVNVLFDSSASHSCILGVLGEARVTSV